MHWPLRNPDHALPSLPEQEVAAPGRPSQGTCHRGGGNEKEEAGLRGREGRSQQGAGKGGKVQLWGAGRGQHRGCPGPPGAASLGRALTGLW